jgi:hypothetical protein
MVELGVGLGLLLGLMMIWREPGTAEESYRQHIKRLAYACRYGHAAPFVFGVDSGFLQDFCNALGEIVEEENRPTR